MQLSTRGRYAVMAMVDLASRQTIGCECGPVCLAEVAASQRLSLSYLEQLFGKLRRHHIVESVRGPGGGYNLGRSPDKVTVADIIIAVDEPIDATQCGGKQNCLGKERPGAGQCMTHELWTTLNAKMVEFLDSVSLQDLVDQQNSQPGMPQTEPKGNVEQKPIVIHQNHQHQFN